MKNKKRVKKGLRRALCYMLALCLALPFSVMLPQGVFGVEAAFYADGAIQENADLLVNAEIQAMEQDAEESVKILVEGENFSSINFELYDYEKDPGLSGGDFLLMKAPAGAVPPEEGFLAQYSFQAPQAGTYDFDMTCLAINGNLGSTIEVKVNDGDFKAYSEQNTVNHGGVDGQVYKKNFFRYTLDTVALKSGENTVTIKIAAPRSTDNRYYYFLDCMEFTKSEMVEEEGAILMEGEHYDSINFVIPDYAKDPALSGGDFLCLKSYAANPIPKEGYQVVYKVSADKAGAYEMTMTSLTLDGNNGSVFDMKVNDGAYVHYDKTSAELLGIVDSLVYKNSFLTYKLPPVVLQAGENTITIKVTEPRAADARQFFFLDCIKFSPIEWNLKSVEPVGASVGVYELGDDVSFKVEYYSEASGAEMVEYKVVDFWGNEAASGVVQAKPGKDGMVIDVPGLARGHYMVYARAAQDRTDAAVRINDGVLGLVSGNDAEIAGNWIAGDVSGNERDPEAVDVLENEAGQASADVSGNIAGDNMLSGLPADVTAGDIDGMNANAGTAPESVLTEAIRLNAVSEGEVEDEEIPWAVCQFSIVTPLSMRIKPADSPFALDAAMLMTYYKTPGFNMETALEYADALALAGVDTVRERYRWNDAVNPQKGV